MAKGRAFKLVIVEVLVALSALVLFGYMCAQAQAAAPKLLITEVQTQSATSKTEEFVELYNPNDADISLKDFKLSYMSSSGLTLTTMQLSPAVQDTSLRAHGFLLVAHAGYNLAADATFTTDLSDTGGHILVTLSGGVIDTVGWGTATKPEASAAVAAQKGYSIARQVDQNGLFQDTDNNAVDFVQSTPLPKGGGIFEEMTDVCPNIDGVQETLPDGLMVDSAGNCSAPNSDVCSNLPDVQLVVPEGYQQSADGSCVAVEECMVEVSEISAQPNFNGQEYVEISNNSTKVMQLQHCSLKINAGAEHPLDNIVLPPGGRQVIPFASGAIRNSAGTITLINSQNEEIVYAYPETSSGQTVNFAAGSQSPVVSYQPTPGTDNVLVLVEDQTNEGGDVTSDLAACPSGKYRNPDTNRCRNIEAAAAILAACSTDQERNPDTNRCRKITTASAALAPCKAGQERNPDTNRCRNIVANTANNALATQVDGSSKQAKVATFSLRVVLLILGAVLAYGVYEYRRDIANLVTRLREKHPRSPPSG